MSAERDPPGRSPDEAVVRHRIAALEAEAAQLRRSLTDADGGQLQGSGPAELVELRAAVEQTDVPLLLTDPNQPDNPVVFANRAFLQLTGYSAAEVLGRNCRFLQGPATDPARVAAIRGALAEDRAVTVELLNYRRDGTPFVNEVRISPVYGPDRRLQFYFGTQADVTLERQDQRGREATEARQRAIFESAVDFAIIATDRDGRITDWNTGAQRVFGPAADGIIGQTMMPFFTPEDRAADQLHREMAVALANGRSSDERWHLRADGTRFWASGELMPLRTPDGVHLGFVKIVRDRTAEHQAGEALRESLALERRYRTVLDTMDVGFCVVEVIFDEQGSPVDYRFIDTNKAFERQTGLTGAVGRTMRSFAPEHEGHWFAIYGEVARTGTPLRFENHAAHLGERWYDVHALRVGDPDDRRVAILFSDISQRKRVEENLRVFNASLERQVAERTADRNALWQLSDDLMLRCTVDGRITAVNPAWLSRLGWPEDELVRTSLFDLIHPEDVARMVEATKGLSPDGRSVRIDSRVCHRAGGYRWIGWSTRLGDDLINAVGRDLTMEKQQAEALRDSIDFARLAMTAVGGVGVWTHDIDSDRFYCDEAIGRLFGLPDGCTAAGLSRAEFLANVHPDDLPRLDEAMAAGQGRRDDLELEYRIRLPDGTIRWVLAREHTTLDGDGRPVRRTGIGLDSTQRHHLEDQLRQAQKMEAVGQLTGGVAHDFNNLLAGITGSLEILSSRLAQGRLTDAERYIAAAQGAAKRAAALTHRLLAFSRRQTLDARPIELNRLVAEIEEMVRRTMGPAIAVEVSPATGLWQALADPNQVENALLNLCINARDAMPDGGRLGIRTGNWAVDPVAAADLDLPPGQYVSLCVSDTGTGMTPEVIAKAFDPFFTTKPLGQGTGLGLSMVYGFVRQSGGQVHIDSQVGAGTTVCLYLPRHLGDQDAAEQPATVGGAPRAAVGQTILVVDDEPIVRMLVQEVLEEFGYAVIEAGDGPSGLRILQSDAHIDVLVTDVGLPGGMNGRQLADAARASRPDLKVLFITGYAESTVLGDQRLDAGMRVLTKPFTMPALAWRIRDLIGASS